MYPHERSLVKEYEGRPFVIIGVNSDRDREQIKAVIKEKDLTWRSFWNGGSTSGPISTAWNVRGWPTTYVIDHEGKIAAKGPRGEALDKVLAKLVPIAEAALK